MKCATLVVLAFLARAYADSDASQLDTRLVNEVSFAERAIDAQLRKDKAPESVRRQEMRFLKQADDAAEAVHRAAGAKRHSSFLAGQQSLSTQSKVANAVDFAEHAVESQLQKDHAPPEIISREKTLLGNASALAHQAAQLQTELQAKRADEKKELAAIHARSSAQSETLSAAGALHAYAKGMAAAVEDERFEIEETKSAQGQAMKALSEMNASAAMKNKVSGLLAKAETLERKTLALDEQTVEESMEESMKESTMQGSHKSGESSSMQTRIAREIDNAEDVVEAQLQKDHAPTKLISEEKTLLENASALVHQAASLRTDLESQQAAERKKLATIHSKAFVKSESQSAAGALQGFTNQMASIVDDDRSEIEETRGVFGQAMKALSKVNATAATKNKVSDLLVKLETLENKELVLDNKAMDETITASIREEIAHQDHEALHALHALKGKVHSILRNSSINATTKKKVEGLLESVEDLEQNVMTSSADSVRASHQDSNADSQTGGASQANLERLEAVHSNLVLANTALKREHAKLLHEKELMAQNSALNAANRELSIENQHLRQELGVAA